MKQFKPKDRFVTHNNREFINRSINKVPTFCSHDARKLRKTIDTGSPAFINDDPNYNDMYARLYKQIGINDSNKTKAENFKKTKEGWFSSRVMSKLD